MTEALQMPAFLAGDDPLAEHLMAAVVDHLLDTEEGTPGVQRAELLAELVKADRASDEGFAVRDLATAEWAMGKVVSIDGEVDELRAQREAWVQRISQWFTQATRDLQARRDYLTGHLIAYAEEYRADDPKHHKTLTVPSGKVRSTEVKPKVEVVSDDAVAEFIATHGSEAQHDALVNTTVKVYVTPLRKIAQVVDWPVPVEERARELTALAFGLTEEDPEWADRYAQAVADLTAADEEHGVPTVPTAVLSLPGAKPDEFVLRPIPGTSVTDGEVTFTVVPDVKG